MSAALRLLIASSVVGCSPDLPEPTLQSVSPAEWYSGLDIELSIEGEDLYPAVQVAGGEVDIDREYRAWLESPLGSIELEGVSLRSYTELSGWVRAGLEPGRYDLRVRTPTGVDVFLPEAFRATETAVRGIGIDFDGTYSPRVGETVAFSIFLEGWDGEPVHQSLEVDVVAERDDGGPVEIEFHNATLSDQRNLADGAGIRGSLDEDGEALILFTSTNPGSLELEVRPVQEDSSVDEARLDLFFEAGAVEDLDVSLSSDSRSFIAGDVISIDLTLLDELGNPAQLDEPLTVHLQEQCSDEIDNDQYTSLIDTRTVTFEIHGATSTSCPENQIIARIAREKGSLEGTSDTFLVSAGDPASFEVVAFLTEVAAGEELVPLLIAVRDQFNNMVTTYSESLIFTDGDGDPLAVSCSKFTNGQAICDVELYTAGEVMVTITNTDASLAGVSEPILVTPGEASVAILSTDANASTADSGRDFTLRVTDAFDNNILIPQGEAAGAPIFSIGATPTACAPDGFDASGYRYHCSLTEASVDRELTVNVMGLATLSPRFDVVNGALHEVLFSGPGDARAGQATSVTLAGYDAYANPFIEAGSGSLDVELFDDSGDVSELVTLGSDGTTTLSSLSFTTAWEDNHLEASQGGQWLGSSAPFTISAADMDHFLVEPERIWGWVDEDLIVQLTAVDPYDNIITAYSGSATVSSGSGLGRPVTTTSWSGGVTEVIFTPTTAGFSDTLSATDGTFLGTSTRFDALDGGCTTPPSAALTIDGNSTGLACRSGGITDTLTISASESDPSTGTLTTWYFYTEPTGWQRSSSENINATWATEGAFEVSVVAATDTACADQASTVLYVADDDGEPAGPITLTAASALLQADTSSSSGLTTVDVSAVSCSGTPASSGTLLVRADIGSLTGSTLSSSGTGLELLLDSSGEGTFTWTTGTQHFAGTGTVYVGRADRAADGSVSATISGDGHQPTVLSVSPAGTRSDTISSLEVQFSEPLLESTINDSTVRLLDPDGLTVDILDHELTDSDLADALTDSLLELTLASDIDLSEGAWTLWLSSGITDADSNALDGTFSGGASAFSLQLGQVSSDAPDLSSCALSVETFRPDGDNGTGSDADSVSLTLSASDVASWWQLEVFDSAGELVVMEHLAAGSASGTVAWDGRGGDGLIVDNGVYTLRAVPLDAAWNDGAGCAVDVTVDNDLQ